MEVRVLSAALDKPRESRGFFVSTIAVCIYRKTSSLGLPAVDSRFTTPRLSLVQPLVQRVRDPSIVRRIIDNVHCCDGFWFDPPCTVVNTKRQVR